MDFDKGWNRFEKLLILGLVMYFTFGIYWPNYDERLLDGRDPMSYVDFFIWLSLFTLPFYIASLLLKWMIKGFMGQKTKPEENEE